jgi:O-antigen/teichoic acid export membrane protein
MKKILGGSLYISAFTILSLPLSYLVRLLLTRHLTLAQFGLFYAVLNFFDTLQSFNDLGFSEMQLYFLPKFIKNKQLSKIKATITAQLVNQILTTVVIGVGIIWLAPFLAENLFHVPNATDVIRVMALYFIAKDFLLNVRVLFFAFQEPRYYSSQEAVRLLLTAVCVVTAVALFKFDLLAAAIIWTGTHTVLAVVYLVMFALSHREIWRANRYSILKIYKEFLPFILPSLLANKAGSVYASGTEILLTFFKGVSEVGLYNIAKPISNLAIALTSPVAAVLKPYISEIDDNTNTPTIKNLISIIINTGVFLLLPFSLLLFFYAKESIVFLFGSQYQNAAWALKVIAFDTLFAVLNPFLFGIVFGLGLQKQRAIVIYVSVALNVGLSLIFIPIFGAMGVGLANLTYSFTAILGALWIIGKRVPFSIPWLNYIKMAILGLFILAIQWIFKLLSPSETMSQLALFIGKAGISLILYYLIGVFLLKIVDVKLALRLIDQLTSALASAKYWRSKTKLEIEEGSST